MPHNVRDDDCDIIFVQRNIIVVVSAYSLGSPIVGVKVIPFDIRTALWQKTSLNLMRNVQIGFDLSVPLALFKVIQSLQGEPDLNSDSG